MTHIDSTVFESITIDGKTYRDDIIILTDGTVKKRGLQKGTHIVCLEEIESLFKEKPKPKTIIIGTGQSGAAKVESEVIEKAKKQNIQFISAPTPEAIKIFNKTKDPKAGLFHLTC